MPPSHDSYSDDDASSSSSASDASFREGASVEAQRREGGKWRAATVLHVSESGATYDLDFGELYGRKEGVAKARVRRGPATAAAPPPRRKRKPAKPPPPRIAESARGLDAVDDFRGDRDAEDALRKSLGWLATRARPADLEDAIADRGVDDVEGLHDWGWLHYAAAAGKDEHVRIILDAVRRAARDDDGGGDDERPAGPLDAKEALDGWTPLHLAVVGRHVAVVRLLLKAGARADAKDKHGDAPLACCAAAGVRAKRVRALLRSKGDDDDPSSSDEDEAPRRRRGRRRAAAPRARPADYDYDADPFPAPRYVYASCAECNALDACESAWRPRPKRRGKSGFTFLRAPTFWAPRGHSWSGP